MGIEIHVPDLTGERLMFDAAGHAIPLFTIPGLGPLYLTNTLLTTWIVMILLVLFSALATRNLQLIPGKVQNIAEMAIETLMNFFTQMMPEQAARRYMPLLATLFIFIITANYLGLVPFVGTVGLPNPAYHAEAQNVAPATSGSTSGHITEGGKVVPSIIPILRAPNSDWNTTLAMALISVVVIQVASVASLSFLGYIKHMAEPGGPMAILIFPLHIIGELARIISLSARLFGNILAGEILIGAISGLTSAFFFGYGLLLPALFVGLEFFFGFIQALIFTALTLAAIAIVVVAGQQHGHGSTTAHTPGVSEEAEEMARGHV